MIDFKKIFIIGVSILLPVSAWAINRSYSLDKEFYDKAYPAPYQSNYAVYSDKIYGGIIPHHLFTREYLGKYFEGLREQNYETIILISPNHYGAGTGKIITSDEGWQTPYGELEADKELVKKLVASGLVVKDNSPFNKEHGISGLVPFIKKSLPQAKVVPLILRNNLSQAEALKFGERLAGLVDKEKVLVLASVDFSHYQTAEVADFHDARSNSCVLAFDYDCLKSAEVDSAMSLISVLKYLEIAGVGDGNLVAQTNSSRLLKKDNEPGTSHSFFIFKSGKSKTTSSVNLLLVGDMMLDRYVRTLIDRQKGEVDFLVKNLAGRENRFFMGLDLVSANLEGAVTNQGAHYPPVGVNDFAMRPKDVKQLKKYNFNFFNLANNHITDQSTKGYLETKNNLNSLNFNYSGCVDGQVKDDCTGKIVVLNGRKIALLGASMVYREIDKKLLAEQIRKYKQAAELVIVQLHWGTEYQAVANKQQADLAHYLIDNGADVIIGHHPHVVQNDEVYKGKPIFYSLGNFMFDQYFSAETQRGLAIGLNWDGKKLQTWKFDLQTVRSAVKLK